MTFTLVFQIIKDISSHVSVDLTVCRWAIPVQIMGYRWEYSMKMTYLVSQCSAWPCCPSSHTMPGNHPQRRWLMEGERTWNRNTWSFRKITATVSIIWVILNNGDQGFPRRNQVRTCVQAWGSSHRTFVATEVQR